MMLIPEILPESPVALLESWLASARESAQRPNSNAMVLATTDSDGRAAARVVLCKGLVADPGYVIFYTNYDSAKAAQLQDVPHAAAVFHWDNLGRQIRLEGPVTRSPESESDAYFQSRDRQSKVGAWASDQSQPIESAEAMRLKMEAATRRFGDSEDAQVPRPPNWGGYRIWLTAVELWAHGNARLHDRARWERSIKAHGNMAGNASAWSGNRLQP
jgi:pyridoxamine 5'-phosphate oxidase